jgi:hypothetical protein
MVSTEILQAKQVLSTRLLRAGLRGNAISMGYTFSVIDAIASARYHVHAVGVGKKIVEGREAETDSVRIYVTQKIAPSLLPPRDRLPETIDGIPTDVIESPPAFLMIATADRSDIAVAAQMCTMNRKSRQRPVVTGISAAHVNVTAGTISCFCRSTHLRDNPSKVYALSNNHVFANLNQSQIGDDLYQPGPADGGILDDHFAKLHRFIPIEIGGDVPNQVDAAIGELLPGVTFQAEVCQIGRINGTKQAVDGMFVCKHGRTTGFTEGIVTDESYDALVGMNHNNPNIVALFENQVRIKSISPYLAFGLGGDSGSLIVNKAASEAVGLYFAGPPSGSYGIANHITDVLEKLEIVIL